MCQCSLVVRIGATVPHSRDITLLSQGGVGPAAKAFDQACESDPWDVWSYYRREATRLDLGENGRAIQVFDEFIDSYPRDAFDPGEWESLQRKRGFEAHEHRSAVLPPIVVQR